MCRGVFLRISRCLPFLRRLLLISSGEVLKFDFPEALDEPNCIPTAEAMHWALPTGDHVAPNPCAPTPPTSSDSPAISHGPNPWFDTYTFPPSWREHRNALRCRIPRTPCLAHSATRTQRPCVKNLPVKALKEQLERHVEQVDEARSPKSLC
jgi:hypothetical protein